MPKLDISQKYLNNYASLALIRKEDNYIFELKDHGYPVNPFIDTLCLFGGSWTDVDDSSPIDTLKREINEELPWVSEKDLSEIKPFSEYLVIVPAELYGRSHNFIASVFELYIESNIGESEEGRIVQFSKEDMKRGNLNKFCWGYEKIISDYIREEGHEISLEGFPEIIVTRLSSDTSTPYRERNLRHCEKNPLLKKVSDQDIFRD